MARANVSKEELERISNLLENQCLMTEQAKLSLIKQTMETKENGWNDEKFNQLFNIVLNVKNELEVFKSKLEKNNRTLKAIIEVVNNYENTNISSTQGGFLSSLQNMVNSPEVAEQTNANRQENRNVSNTEHSDSDPNIQRGEIWQRR